ncbi:sensor histidine kinase [Brachybacterium sp. AOP25-B2-12]|uniref:sensor histidine kinase n=1 Tax=Brachybacterium sp. AOP25-B2-12 TaxID=3457710 RepID=UPI004033CFC2
MTVPAPPAPSPRAGLPARDLALAGVYGALAVVLTVVPVGTSGVGDASPALGRWLPLAILLIACAGVTLRRTRPVVTLALTGPLALTVVILDGHVMAFALLFEALFTPVVHGSRRLARIATVAGAACGVLLIVLVAAWPVPGALIVGLLIVTVVVATPLMWGWEVRHHREARRTAEALAAAEHRLAQERSARAVDGERRRIAQDLHDLVAGHLSAVSLHAGLAQDLPDGPARSTALTTTRDAARAALTDLRALIDVLVEDDADGVTAPAPTIGWDELRARLAPAPAEPAVPAVPADAPSPTRTDTSALRVDPAVDDPTRVDPAVRAVLLRITAEAVTNAMRHGTGPRELAITVGEDIVELTGTNPVPADRRPPHEEGTGLGLATIAHQARAVGGWAGAGPDPADRGTWTLRARLPRFGAGPIPGGRT